MYETITITEYETRKNRSFKKQLKLTVTVSFFLRLGGNNLNLPRMHYCFGQPFCCCQLLHNAHSAHSVPNSRMHVITIPE